MTDFKRAKSKCLWLLREKASHNEFVARLEGLLQDEAKLSAQELQDDYDEDRERSLAYLLFGLCEKLRDPERDKATVEAAPRLRYLRDQLCIHRLARYRLSLKFHPPGPMERVQSQKQQQGRGVATGANKSLPQSALLPPQSVVSVQSAVNPKGTMKDRLERLRSARNGLRNK